MVQFWKYALDSRPNFQCITHYYVISLGDLELEVLQNLQIEVIRLKLESVGWCNISDMTRAARKRSKERGSRVPNSSSIHFGSNARSGMMEVEVDPDIRRWVESPCWTFDCDTFTVWGTFHDWARSYRFGREQCLCLKMITCGLCRCRRWGTQVLRWGTYNNSYSTLLNGPPAHPWQVHCAGGKISIPHHPSILCCNLQLHERADDDVTLQKIHLRERWV